MKKASFCLLAALCLLCVLLCGMQARADTGSTTVTLVRHTPNPTGTPSSGDTQPEAASTPAGDAQTGEETARPAPQSTPAPYELKLNAAELRLQKGKTWPMKPEVLRYSGRVSYTWTSSDKNVAVVAYGTLRTPGAGQATLTCTALLDNGEELRAELHVTVFVTPTSITIKQGKSVTVDVGRSEQLEATFLPKDTTERALTWSSSDPSIVRVDGQGRVTALAAGKAIITAEAPEGTAKPVSVAVCVPSLDTSASYRVKLTEYGEQVVEIPYHGVHYERDIAILCKGINALCVTEFDRDSSMIRIHLIPNQAGSMVINVKDLNTGDKLDVHVSVASSAIFSTASYPAMSHDRLRAAKAGSRASVKGNVQSISGSRGEWVLEIALTGAARQVLAVRWAENKSQPSFFLGDMVTVYGEVGKSEAGDILLDAVYIESSLFQVRLY